MLSERCVRASRGTLTLVQVRLQILRIEEVVPLPDSYGVAIIPGADTILILAITVIIDMMLNKGDKSAGLFGKRGR